MPDPPSMAAPDTTGSRALREVLLAFLGVSLATWVVTSVGRGPPLDAYVALAVAAVFLFAAIELASRAPTGLRGHGLGLGGLLDPAETAATGPWASARDLARALRRAIRPALRETGFAFLVAAAIVPPFVAGFYLWHGPARPFALVVPDAPTSYVLSQLVVTALPEEAFFRGYVQTRLGVHFVRRVRWLGADLSPGALVLQAVLFAAIHVVAEFDARRLAVFFPALLFGWMRARRHGIGAATVMHALSNVLSDLLTRGWL